MDIDNFESEFESSSKKIYSLSPFKKIARKQKTKHTLTSSEPEKTPKKKFFTKKTSSKDTLDRKKVSSLEFLEEEMCAVASSSSSPRNTTRTKLNTSPRGNDYIMTGTRSVQYHYQNSSMNSPRHKLTLRQTQSDSMPESTPPREKKEKQQRRLSL